MKTRDTIPARYQSLVLAKSKESQQSLAVFLSDRQHETSF